MDLPLSQEVVDGLKKIRLVISDVDGVLSRGIHLDSRGEEIKVFSPRDGSRIFTAVKNGINFIMISGRDSPAARSRANELKVPFKYRGELNVDGKNPLEYLTELYKVEPEEVMYIGDDWGDLWWFSKVGVSAAPADADEECRLRAKIVTNNRGGEGAVAELLNYLFHAKGIYNPILEQYLKEPIYKKGLQERNC